MALRAITRTEHRVSHPSEDDLPEAERTWFRFEPATAQQWGRIRDAGLEVEPSVNEDGSRTIKQVFRPGRAAVEYLHECLTGIDNLLGEDGQPIELPTETVDGRQRLTYAALDAIPAGVQVWLAQQIQAASQNTEQELGESSSQPT